MDVDHLRDTPNHEAPVGDRFLHAMGVWCACGPVLQLQMQDDGTTEWVFHHHPMDLEDAS